ncbi:MAG: type II secretion system protein [Chthoniobacterales bacterium]
MRNQGFSLVESLVTAVILAVLAIVGTGTVQNALNQGAMVRETSAAKVLMTAYIQAAGENDGKFMPGYDNSAGEVTMRDGTVISGVEARRYPFRLAPYMDYRIEGTILVGKNAKQLKSGMGASYNYMISCFPAFGINHLFVGGNIESNGTTTFSGECIDRQSRATASIMVFATAAGSNPDGDGKIYSGFCKVEPPNLTVANWKKATWTKGADPGKYGQVDARYNDRAICAFLDGSVRLHSIEELRNMALWSRNAAEQHNPDYLIPDPRGSTPKPPGTRL